MAGSTKVQFAWIPKDGGTVSGASNRDAKDKNNIDKMDEICSKFERLEGSWNTVKAEQYAKDIARSFSSIPQII